MAGPRNEVEQLASNFVDREIILDLDAQVDAKIEELTQGDAGLKTLYAKPDIRLLTSNVNNVK